MEVMTLSAVVLASVLSFSKNSEHVNGEDLPRLEALAVTIAEVVREKGCLFPEEKNCEEVTALALVAVAFHESGFASDVQDCSRCVIGGAWCDHGRAISLYQMQRNNWQGHARAAVCKDNRLATSLAYDSLAKPRGSWKNKFRVYAGRKHTGAELLQLHQLAIQQETKRKASKNGS